MSPELMLLKLKKYVKCLAVVNQEFMAMVGDTKFEHLTANQLLRLKQVYEDSQAAIATQELIEAKAETKEINTNEGRAEHG